MHQAVPPSRRVLRPRQSRPFLERILASSGASQDPLIGLGRTIVSLTKSEEPISPARRLISRKVLERKSGIICFWNCIRRISCHRSIRRVASGPSRDGGSIVREVRGQLLAYYMTFGEYDFLIVSEGLYEGAAVSVAVGGAMDLKTTLTMTSGDMKNAFAKAGAVAGSFRPAGAKT